MPTIQRKPFNSARHLGTYKSLLVCSVLACGLAVGSTTAATQGKAGRTSTATAKITLRIHPRNADEALAYNSDVRLLELQTSGYKAVNSYCQMPSASNEKAALRLSHSSDQVFQYRIEANTESGTTLSPTAAQAALDARCRGFLPLDASTNTDSLSNKTLIVAPI